MHIGEDVRRILNNIASPCRYAKVCSAGQKYYQEKSDIGGGSNDVMFRL